MWKLKDLGDPKKLRGSRRLHQKDTIGLKASENVCVCEHTQSSWKSIHRSGCLMVRMAGKPHFVDLSSVWSTSFAVKPLWRKINPPDLDKKFPSSVGLKACSQGLNPDGLKACSQESWCLAASGPTFSWLIQLFFELSCSPWSLPSVKLTVHYGKSQFFMGKSTINGHGQVRKLLVYHFGCIQSSFLVPHENTNNAHLDHPRNGYLAYFKSWVFLMRCLYHCNR